MAKPLSDKAQRLVFGALVAGLVTFGIYLSLGGFNGSGAGEPDSDSGDKKVNASSPSPIPTTAAKDMKVLDWMPLEEDEIKAAAVVAQQFGTAYGTIDYSKPQGSYYASLESLAAKDYAKTLAQSSGASALWGENAKKKRVSEGRADVAEIRSFSEESVVFLVKVQSITKGAAGATGDLGEFAVTVVKEGKDWKVYDFQPADAANLGGE